MSGEGMKFKCACGEEFPSVSALEEHVEHSGAHPELMRLLSYQGRRQMAMGALSAADKAKVEKYLTMKAMLRSMEAQQELTRRNVAATRAREERMIAQVPSPERRNALLQEVRVRYAPDGEVVAEE